MIRTLVVDDDSNAQQKIVRYLQGRGVSADIAADPMSAFAKLSNETYDYVFLDLDLGAGISDGEGVLAWMDSHERRIPTLVISEAAAQPQVIRLEKAFEFVVVRMTHGDLDHLSDVVDRHMFSRVSLDKKSGSASQSNTLAMLISTLLIGAILLLATLTFIRKIVPGVGFSQVVTAGVLVFLLITVVALFAIGRITERGFTGVVAEVLKQLGSIGK
jgi:CheY-like chemotaxis protein